MIKISTRGRYGVRLMFDLAMCFGQGPILLKDIAQRQDVSEKYLWQLLTPLKNAGLLGSSRGPRGGYYLTKNPGQITLKDIVSILEGKNFLVECLDNRVFCKRSNTCIAREVWASLSEKISEELSAVTLGDMVKKAKKRRQTKEYCR